MVKTRYLPPDESDEDRINALMRDSFALVYDFCDVSETGIPDPGSRNPSNANVHSRLKTK